MYTLYLYIILNYYILMYILYLLYIYIYMYICGYNALYYIYTILTQITRLGGPYH